MKTAIFAILICCSAPVFAQTTPNCPDGYKACGNVCCPK